MIFGTLLGDRDLVARLQRMPAATKPRIDATVQALGFMLEAKVKAQKLSGQVLGVRTGRLRASISQSSARAPGDSRSRFVSTPTASLYYVGTNVAYGGAWEFGSRAHDIVAKNALALRFEIGGQVFFRRRVHIPAQSPRPFLAPALQEMKPMIIERLRMALVASAQQGLRK